MSSFKVIILINFAIFVLTLPLKKKLFQILEKSLRILFETKDVSLVKRFVQRQFGKISTGSAPLQDLTFAREFRGMSGYRPNACVPALELSR